MSERSNGPARIPSRRNWEIVGICALLAALVWCVFGQTVRFEFVNYDDMFVYQTPEVAKGLTFDGLGWAFMHGQVGAWIPLSTLSHMVDCQIFGLWPGGHHLTNVLLHAAAAILLFLVLRQMTGALWRSAFVAALFAIHPLRAESVAWVTERKDVLSGTFFMITLWAYSRYARRSESRGSYAMVLVWFALGLMSKSMLVTVPFILLLLDYWPLGRFHKASDLPGLLKEKIPLFALSILSCVGALFAAKGAIQPMEHMSFFSRVGNALVAYIIYIGKLIHPSQLAPFYPLSEGGRGASQVIGACLLLTALTAGAWVLRRRQPFLLVGWLWYLGMLVPVVGFVQVGVQAYADRFTYLPQIGLCFAGTWAAADWAGSARRRRVAMAAAAAAVLLFLLVTAYRQTSYWRDSITLWTHTFECTPDNASTRFTLGDALGRQGRTAEAVAEYREALRINPDYVDARNNLGLALAQQGQTDEAIAQYRVAQRINPDDVNVHNNLGLALARQGRAEEAIAEYRKALRMNPDRADVHNNLAVVLAQRGQIDEAIAEYREALRVNPAFAEAHCNLGAALARQGKTDEAIAEYREALRVNPDYADAHNNLGLVLAQQGQIEEAIVHIKKALELQPSSLSHQNNLAWMLATAPQASLRDGPRALELAMKANQATGGSNPNIVHTLAAAYAEAGKFSDAVRAAQQALEMAEAESNPARVDELRRELKLYQAGRSFENAR